VNNNQDRIGEFDDYPIPAYDTNIPDDERKRKKADAIKELQAFINKTKPVEKAAS